MRLLGDILNLFLDDTCLVSSLLPVYLTCVYSYFPFFFPWLTNKIT